jgi:hypothetical protein
MNDSEKSALRLEVEKIRSAARPNGCKSSCGFWTTFFAARRRRPFRPAESRRADFTISKTPAATPRAASASRRSPPRRTKNSTPNAIKSLTGSKPSADAVVAETVGAGYTFQGKLLRPALVKLRETNPGGKKPKELPATFEMKICRRTFAAIAGLNFYVHSFRADKKCSQQFVTGRE